MIWARSDRNGQVAFYVLLDGFDLGIGMLFPFARNESERDQR